MTPPTKRRQIPIADLVDAVEQAAREGRFEVARGLAEDAMKREPRSASIRKLACLVAMGARDMTTAVTDAARWLALQPTSVEAARTLTRLADTYEFANVGALDPRGLGLAMATPGVSWTGVARLAVRQAIESDRGLLAILDAPPDVLERAGRDIGRGGRLPHALASDLLLEALGRHVLADLPLERLLTGFRAGLLDAGPDSLVEPAHFDLALALLRQLWLNDHAFADTPEEREKATAIALDRARLMAGDLGQSRRLLLRQLYQPVQGPDALRLTADEARSLRPKAYGIALAERLARDEHEIALRMQLKRLGAPADATGRDVKAQYERSPYPRWVSLACPEPGSLVRYLKMLPGMGSAALLDRPLRVLIAGAGTGQQVIRSRIGYGPTAAITALDLSEPSLAYGMRMADELGAGDITWVAGDLTSVGDLGARFDVIECVGVLHHMADPWAGWRSLLDVLEPGGLMYVGLYSEVARAPIRAARNDPASPGPTADDIAARAWRRTLIDRPPDAPTASLLTSRNFHSSPEFRDLVLHVSERTTTLPAIAEFLDKERLEFLGLTLSAPVLSAFATRFPGTPKPGRLEDWATFEAENPATFEAMYCVWVRKAV